MAETNARSLRSREEIQAAHDRLMSILRGEAPFPSRDPQLLRSLSDSASVLCWVLRHGYNQTFAANLQMLDVWYQTHTETREDGETLEMGGDERGGREAAPLADVL